jgi:hypothetical protein
LRAHSIRHFTNNQASACNTSDAQNNSPKPNSKAPSGNALSVKKLFEAKRSALRHGIWYRALNKLERGVVDLTVRYVNDVKSTKLAQVLTAIIQKLQVAAESIVDKMVKSIGFAQAKKISEIASRLGNRSACAWAGDSKFARYLAVMHMNGTGLFKA